MLTSSDIERLLNKINVQLFKRGEIGEIGIVGGAAMCLLYNARSATKDVDAIFEPSATLREIAGQIAEEENIPDDWLNDAVKAYLRAGFEKQNVLALSNLTVWAPEPRYMLAMKCISARWDTSDREDVIFLLKLLQLTVPEEVFKIIEAYYPKNQIPAKTKFFIEEILSCL